MKKLTQVVNAILGAGTHRRASESRLPKSDARIWEVRCKHNVRPRTKR